MRLPGRSSSTSGSRATRGSGWWSAPPRSSWHESARPPCVRFDRWAIADQRFDVRGGGMGVSETASPTTFATADATHGADPFGLDPEVRALVAPAFSFLHERYWRVARDGAPDRPARPPRPPGSHPT